MKNISFSPDINPFQKTILTKLIQNHEGLKYSELQIEDVENDLFNYHLQYLVNSGFIAKQDKIYSLTEAGSKLVSTFDTKGNIYNKFKVSVALYVFRYNNTEILLQKRLRTPFYGDITGVAGKIKEGESIIDAAKRKLFEEQGLIGDFKHVGQFRKIRRNKDNEILEDTFYNICICENPTGDLIVSNEFGENAWYKCINIFEFMKANVDASEIDFEIYRRLIAHNLEPFLLESDKIVDKY